MRRGPSGILGRLLAAAAAAAILIGSTGCSYLQWKQAQHERRVQLKKNPADLALAREYAPQDCFGLVGRIQLPAQSHTLLAAAFSHGGSTQLVGWATVDRTRGYYAIVLPSGSYDLLFFADRDGDGLFLTDEVVGRTPPDSPVRVDAASAADGIAVPAPEVTIDFGTRRAAPIAVPGPTGLEPGGSVASSRQLRFHVETRQVVESAL